MIIIPALNRKTFISVDKKECKVILSITKTDYRVDFNVANSIYKIFGFNKDVYSQGTHKGSNKPDIAPSQTMSSKKLSSLFGCK